MEEIKHFTAKLPEGYLIVKANEDSDYPGVFVAYSKNDCFNIDDLVGCVEYDKSNKELLTHLYSRDSDDPITTVRFDDGKVIW